MEKICKEKFPGCERAFVRDYEIVLVENTADYKDDILSLKDDVLKIAANSRGWFEKDEIEHIKSFFKIDPLFKATALALVLKNNTLLGTCGAVNNWHHDRGSILHLCSVNFLPEIQTQGIFPLMFILLWITSLKKKIIAEHFINEKLFLTAISQSPFVLKFFNVFFDTFPSPLRKGPDDQMIWVAQEVTKRFNPHLTLDVDEFILRKECNFFYKEVPFTNRKDINDYCSNKLNFADGDVFVIVGKPKVISIKSFVLKVVTKYKTVFENFKEAANVIKFFDNIEP